MPATKSLTYTVTVLCGDGSNTEWDITGRGVEEAAKRAAKRVCLRGFSTVRRTSGKEGEPGWFVPEKPGRWPFAGPAFKVEPKGVSDE